jgi:hypothetical protein
VAGGVRHFSLAAHLLLLELALVHVARGPGEDTLPVLLVVEELALRGRKTMSLVRKISATEY